MNGGQVIRFGVTLIIAAVVVLAAFLLLARLPPSLSA